MIPQTIQIESEDSEGEYRDDTNSSVFSLADIV